MSSQFRRRRSIAAAIALCAGASPRAFAQGASLEEIVVTAERREASLQQTPISVAAFTAEQMELRGVETLEDIATLTPNLDIKGSRGTGNVNPTYQVRGLSGGGALGERSVAMYIDGVFMPRTTGPFMNVLDIERIEVLRGPQGTLFGRNSTGGAIRVFTHRPGPEREGYVRLSAGNFDRADLSAMLNVPLSDSVFFRVQGGSLSQDGYVRRGSQLLGSSEDTVGRLQLALEPSDDLRVTFSLSSTESESDGNPQDLETFDMLPDLNYQGGRADWISDFLQAAGEARIDPNNDPRIVLDDFTMPDWCFLDDADPDWDAACEQTNRSEYRQFDANVTWDLNDRTTFTSITGVSDFESAGVTDWVMLGTEAREANVQSDVIYQELQLNVELQRFDIVTGVSYFQEDVYGSPGTGGPNYDRRGTSAFPAAANGNGVAVGSGPNGLFVTVLTDGKQRSESWGAFANATWHITDRLNLTPGIRFAVDEKEIAETRFAANDFVPFGGAPSTSIFADDDWDNTDWRVTLDYNVTDDIMLYATSSEAFRAGAYSYNIAATSSGEVQTQAIAAGTSSAFTPPERVRNDEIGARTEWFDGRLRLNLTYFDMGYTNRQGAVNIPEPSLPTGFRIQLVNTGDVDVSGFELEGQIAATENFTIDFSAGAVDAQILDVCANNGDFILPGPVEDSYALGGRWSHSLERGALLTVGLTLAYTGPQQTHPGGTLTPCFDATGAPNLLASGLLDSRYELPDYSLVNGRVRYTSADGTWELSLFGNNLTDEVYGNYASRFGGAFWDTPTGVGPVASPQRSALGVTRGRPREYGLSFQYNFGGGAAARR
jgi:iron complex outermembrane receptor protein